MAKSRVILFFLALNVSLCFGQQPSYVQYTTNEGLPSNTVYYAIQDLDGYIWIGTDRGVSRFDGREFSNYSFKNGLSENEVFDLYQDNCGRIWFAGFNGIPCYYYRGKFYGREITHATVNFSNTGFGLKVLQDRNGVVFYCTREAIYRIDQNQVKEFSQENFFNSTLFYDQDSAVYSLGTSMEYIRVTNLTEPKLYEVERKNSTVAPRLNTKALLVKNQLYFSNGNQLIAINLENESLQVILNFEEFEMLQSVQQRDDSSLWLGTKNGLYIFDLASETISKKLFTGIAVSSVLRDMEDNLWITSLNQGVYQVSNEEVELIDSHAGIDFDNCQFISVVDTNEIVIGSKGFKCAFIKDSVITNITLPQGMGEGKIQSVKKDLQGKICIATGITYYQLFDDYTKIETHMAAVSDVLFMDDKSLYAQGDRILLVTDQSLGAKDILRNSYIHSSSPIDLKAKKIFVTSDSVIYATGTFGVRKITGNTIEKLTDHFLLNSNIVDFVETSDGLQWFASSLNGVVVRLNNSLIQLTTANGLATDFITSLEVSPNGDVWAGTQGGLSKISYSLAGNKFLIESFGKTDGLVSEQINDIAFFKNELWVATDQGTCVFHDLKKEESQLAPKMIIESVFVNSKKTALSDEYEVPHNNLRIKINFTGISFRSLENVSFLYRIGGEENEWVQTSNTSLEYTAMPTGENIFEIKAIGATGEVSEIKQIRFNVAPAFYQTFWFVGICVMLTSIIIYFLINRRIRKLNKEHSLAQYLLKLENEKLESENKVVEFNKNLAELEQKALMLHMNPHFIFNSINAINGFYASGDIDNAKVYVSKFSNLLRSILDSSQRKLILMREEIELLENYLQLNQLRFNYKFNYTIQLDPALNVNLQYIPPMMIQPFVENAIIHGIASLESKGQINIVIHTDDTYLTCEITDNGIGIKASEEKNKNRLHNSTGIKISADRIKLYAGTESDANLQIVENKTSTGAVCGTTVTFRIKKENLW